ncbi:MAG: response regulator transcription factor [Novosphingobium sp.]
MDDRTTLLITSPSAARLGDIAQQRPDWRVILLGETIPTGPLPGHVWGIIDWLCPSLSGLELCRRLREAPATQHAHLTMVLDQQDSEARRRSLQAGADDYIVGPLDAERLFDRIGGLSRDIAAERKLFTHGAVSVDQAAHQVRIDGKVVPLRPNELRLLLLFLENPDQVFSRQALIDKLGKHALGIDERTVDVWIGRLRRALIAHGAPDPLRTVRSLGYVLDSIA